VLLSAGLEEKRVKGEEIRRTRENGRNLRKADFLQKEIWVSESSPSGALQAKRA